MNRWPPLGWSLESTLPAGGFAVDERSFVALMGPDEANPLL